MEPRGAVLENELEDRPRLFAKGLQPLGDDPTASGGSLPESQIPDGQEMAAVFVAARAMQQQVANGVQAKAGQLRAPLGADTP